MLKILSSVVALVLTLAAAGFSQTVVPPDSPVSTGRPKLDEFIFGKNKLKISFLGHGTLMLDYKSIIIHIDPVGQYANYDSLPKADLILITHEHGDHLDKTAIAKLKKKETVILLNQPSEALLKEGKVLANGQKWEGQGLKVEAVPAYNITPDRTKFHPKGRDNGYVLTLGGKRIYIGGDTEDIPEMAALKNIDIAFLPMNQPYTMTPEQAAQAVKMIKPKLVYPYHFGDTDPNKLAPLLSDLPQVEIRVRDLQ